MKNVNTPEEALEITRKSQEDADRLSEHVARLIASLRTIQRENGFAPRMALAYQRSR